MKKANYNFKKTYILIGILALLFGIVYFFDNPRKINEQKNAEITNPIFENFKKEDIAKINIKNTDNEVILDKKDDNWVVNSKKDYPATLSKINDILSEIEKIKTENIASKNKDQQDYFEVTDKLGIHVIAFDKNKKEVANFYLGKNGSPKWDDQYIRKDKEDVIYKITSSIKSLFVASSEYWMDKKLLVLSPFKADEISQLSILNEGKKITLKKENNVLKMTEPENSELDTTKKDQLLNNIINLNANSFLVTDDKKQYGLEEGKEKLKIFIQKADNSNITIRFGVQESDTNFYFATVSGNTNYFKVDKASVEALMVKAEEMKKK